MSCSQIACQHTLGDDDVMMMVMMMMMMMTMMMMMIMMMMMMMVKKTATTMRFTCFLDVQVLLRIAIDRDTRVHVCFIRQPAGSITGMAKYKRPTPEVVKTSLGTSARCLTKQFFNVSIDDFSWQAPE